MKTKFLIAFAIAVTTLSAQRITDRRSSSIRGGGGDGKCTIEVVVDDVAQVEIRGRDAVIRTLNGGPATFRRFECNQEMPNRPNDFRFRGIDGRGRQELIDSPERGGLAVIRIEDSKGGSEGYTFDIFWNGGNYGGGGGGGRGFGRDGDGFGGRGRGRGFGNDNGWNDGWGNGSGWNNRSFRYSGGRRGGGSFRDQNGRRRRLDFVTVTIRESGDLVVAFTGENGRIELTGVVNTRNNRRVIGTVNGGGRSGGIVIEMSSYEEVSRITMDAWDLSWSN